MVPTLRDVTRVANLEATNRIFIAVCRWRVLLKARVEGARGVHGMPLNFEEALGSPRSWTIDKGGHGLCRASVAPNASTWSPDAVDGLQHWSIISHHTRNG